MPQTKYGSVDEMIASLPAAEKVIVNRLRLLIRECLPKSVELAYYGLAVPFYRHHRLICFIWPSSVIWGKDKSPNAKEKRGIVSLGFNQGYLMAGDKTLLAEGRKQIHIHYIKSIKELDEEKIRAQLFEAGMIDDDFGRKKVKKKKT